MPRKKEGGIMKKVFLFLGSLLVLGWVSSYPIDNVLAQTAPDPCRGKLELVEINIEGGVFQACCKNPQVKCPGGVCALPECKGQLTQASSSDEEVVCCDISTAP